MIIYDCEIIKAIAKKGEEKIPGIEYCDGWQYFENMGIACICAYDYDRDRYRTFLSDNFDEFQRMCHETDLIVGFNSLAFDNQLCRASGFTIDDKKSYDILVEILDGVGLGRKFKYSDCTGYGLDDCCKANFGRGKTGNGAFAPVEWQRGEYGKVIDYCLNDVWLTKRLLDRIIRCGYIVDPKYIKRRITIKHPFEVSVI